MTASSTFGLQKPGNGRLYLKAKPGTAGGWVAGNRSNGSWFQVKFGGWPKVTKISTQGREDAPQWVTKYRVSYSSDGIFFKDYTKVIISF